MGRGRVLTIVVVIAGLITGAYLFPVRHEVGRQATIGGPDAASTKVWSGTVIAQATSSSATGFGGSARTQPAGSSSLTRRYETSTDKKSLFDELDASDSPEAAYFAARVLRDCRPASGGLARLYARFDSRVFATSAGDSAPRQEALRKLYGP
jgi:hypothetical protein